MGPERLHDLNGFPCLRPAVHEVATHEFRFLPQPARANAEQEAAAAKPIEAGDLLGQEEGVALGNQGNARAEFNGAGDPGSPGQGDVGIGEMGISPGDLAAGGGEGAGAVDRHRGMLRVPDRLETEFLGFFGHKGRVDGIGRQGDGCANIHDDRLLCCEVDKWNGKRPGPMDVAVAYDAMRSNLQALSPRIAARSVSLKLGVSRTCSTAVLVHG